MNVSTNRAADDIDDAAAQRPFNPDGGEDESSTSDDGDDAGTHHDQRPVTDPSSSAADVADDDPNKAEKLTKAGRDLDPDAGGN